MFLSEELDSIPASTTDFCGISALNPVMFWRFIACHECFLVFTVLILYVCMVSLNSQYYPASTY